MANATTNAILDNIRSRLPGVTDDVAKLEIFNTVDELAREALRTTAPSDVDAEPDTWLAADLWVPNYSVILEGTLARLYAQVNKPWFSVELAKVHSDRYMALLGLARQEASGAPSSAYGRLLANLRVQIPMARDAALRLEIYNTVDKIRREALRLAPLAGADTSETTWLPADKWDDCYQAILHGSLSRLYSQTGNAWANPQMASAQFALYQTELELVRNEQASSAARDFDKLMDMARVRLPGARDNIIKLELFMAVEEFLANSNCWTEEVPFEVNPNETTYYIFTIASASINRLMLLTTGTGIPVAARMPEPGTIQLHNPPSEVGTYKAVVSLSVTEPTDPEGYPELPEWVLSKYNGEILDGVLGRMMSQLAKPYSQPNLASFHMKRFEQAIRRASTEARHGMVYSGQNWAFPQNFAYRRKLQW